MGAVPGEGVRSDRPGLGRRQLTATVVTDLGALDDATLEAWDAMAIRAGSPCALSGWVLGAARHLSGRSAVDLLLLRDAGVLVGVAAFQHNRWDGLLPIEAWIQVTWNFGHGNAPLASHGHEGDLADAIARHFADREVSPSMLTIAWDDLDSPWPARLALAWDGRIQHRIESSKVCPIVTMAAGHDAWLAAKSRNFRQNIKRRTKAIASRGGFVRRSDDPAQVRRDVVEIWDVHRARFASLHKTSDLTDGHRAALLDAAPSLVAGGHLRVWVIEHEGRVVAGQIHVRAGDGMYFYNGGMDPDWAHQAPGEVLLHAAVQDAHTLGVRALDLGPGAFPYKLHFADAERQIASHDLFAIDGRYLATRARLARKHLTLAARHWVAELPEDRRNDVKRLLRRR